MRLVYTVIMPGIGGIFPLVDCLGINRNNVYQNVLISVNVIGPWSYLDERLKGGV